jgi:hypothetical protein
MELIKRKLADYRCRVSMKVLNRGLITPIIKNSMRNSLLPNAARSVHVNPPVEKKGKKKKRGKKRK